MINMLFKEVKMVVYGFRAPGGRRRRGASR